ncbi:hypothetical protein GUITHDRAFT_103131 [Guillardia theta CCMP2712]|uniref:Alkaline phosphatase n=1 Tax=Guillardia theta (strain CCMP2712) TaxID=905079 RepID=L1JSD4_GUITC|nr:hypothetical protein GUITHDRAFT_103131 [Guillardia theta CCMP2712]EKX51214.1 hypothetical protein GUITHDRAFT_103131 [Guillardia theta CCMP2712]|eukprot:XP_005838194.1 hypothetical protein GUITHDRAFT_103131 [Guillardia theta CCMP2712]
MGLVAVVVLVIFFSAVGKEDKSKMKPVMCAGGNGTLRRISREAYDYWSRVNPKAERSLVIMLGDGYGPDVHSMSRSVMRKMLGNESYRLPLDDFLVGTSITSALGNVITDSAAGATAYANGVKTVNGAIGVEPADLSEHGVRKCADSLGGTKKTPDCPVADQTSCCPLKRIANAFEGCRAKGMATGLVVLFAQAARQNKVVFQSFLLNSVKEEAKSRSSSETGDSVVKREMTEAALTRLKATGKKFCLMVEGSRIDHALHGNDAAGAAFDTFAYNDAFEAVNRFIEAERTSGHEIEVISVADHSCGGITTGMQTNWQPKFSQPICLPGGSCQVQIGTSAYGTTDGWTPEVLARARISLPQLSAQVCCNQTLRKSFPSVLARIQDELGISPSSEDQANFQQAASRVAFTTASHTSVDINVYASWDIQDRFRGSNENDEIGRRIIREVLELDSSVMDPISQALEECQVPVVP